jgi:hypothetical protein
MKPLLLYFGPQWDGSTSLQRLQAFQRMEQLRVLGIDSGAIIGGKASLWRRLRWRLRMPVDSLAENERLLTAARNHGPDIVLVDNSRVIRTRTLSQLRDLGVRRLVYYSPDDIVARHNLSLPLRASLPHWDIVCTTKTFNVPELASLGVRRALLIGKAYDPDLHKPMSRADVGEDYERFDAVFIGAYERERARSLNALAATGIRLVIYGKDKGGWRTRWLHDSVDLRPSLFGREYVAAWHTGKVALCFLRKINRDRITQRTMEIAAMGRPMVGERTDEHDAHFEHGREYIGFASDDELRRAVEGLLQDDERRIAVGAAGRRRCITRGYSTDARAREMLAAVLDAS